jgi:hypothetical protein
VNELIWHLFSQTGNVEAYLLLKSIESERQEADHKDLQEIASYQTKL